jgi:hypothetical protein
MISILFWNVGAKPRREQVAQLAKNFDVDVVLLAESVDQPNDLLKVLNQTKTEFEYAPGTANTKIAVFARFSKSYISPIFETDRLR